MSLVCPVGPEGNLLEEPSMNHCKRLVVRHPVLTLEEMRTLKNQEYKFPDGKTGFSTHVIDTTFPKGSGPDGMLQALERVCNEAADAIQGGLGNKGVEGVILSDKLVGPDRVALPSLLAVGAVHQHLLKTQQRPKAAIFAEAGDIKEVHDYATIFGYGCDGVCPYVAYEALSKMNAEGLVEAKSKQEFTDDQLFANYRNAAAKGLLKVMSKMGISTLQSYKAAQVSCRLLLSMKFCRSIIFHFVLIIVHSSDSIHFLLHRSSRLLDSLMRLSTVASPELPLVSRARTLRPYTVTLTDSTTAPTPSKARIPFLLFPAMVSSTTARVARLT